MLRLCIQVNIQPPPPHAGPLINILEIIFHITVMVDFDETFSIKMCKVGDDEIAWVW